MRRLFAFVVTSLDGFVEDGQRSLAWFHPDAEFHDFAERQLAATGALLFGRRTYEHMAAAWQSAALRAALPETARLMNQRPKIVASRQPYEPAWGPARAVGTDLGREIAALKAEPGDDLAVFGSNDLLAGLLEAGQLDELRLMLAPLALGGGTPLLGGMRVAPRFELLEARPFRSGPVLLRYGVK